MTKYVIKSIVYVIVTNCVAKILMKYWHAVEGIWICKNTPSLLPFDLKFRSKQSFQELQIRRIHENSWNRYKNLPFEDDFSNWKPRANRRSGARP